MMPQMQPSKEQVLAHFGGLVKQRQVSLRCFTKQRTAKDLRFAVAVAALQLAKAKYVKDSKNVELEDDAIIIDYVPELRLEIASKTFEADQLEYEASCGQLDLMIEQTKAELAQFEKTVKELESNVVLPGQVGVVM